MAASAVIVVAVGSEGARCGHYGANGCVHFEYTGVVADAEAAGLLLSR